MMAIGSFPSFVEDMKVGNIILSSKQIFFLRVCVKSPFSNVDISERMAYWTLWGY
jgi:hypothetical protein